MSSPFGEILPHQVAPEVSVSQGERSRTLAYTARNVHRHTPHAARPTPRDGAGPVADRERTFGLDRSLLGSRSCLTMAAAAVQCASWFPDGKDHCNARGARQLGRGCAAGAGLPLRRYPSLCRAAAVPLRRRTIVTRENRGDLGRQTVRRACRLRSAARSLGLANTGKAQIRQKCCALYHHHQTQTWIQMGLWTPHTAIPMPRGRQTQVSPLSTCK